MIQTVERTNGRPSDELRRDDARRSSGCGGCGGHGAAGAPHPGIVRPTHPWPEHKPEGSEAFVDWLTRKMMNTAQRGRNFFYKVRSYRYARALGYLDHERYHLRRLHCDGCEHRKADDKTGLEFCSADSCGCGKTKRACLTAKVRLAAWQCPIGRFGVRHQVTAPHDTRKVET